MSIVNKRSMRDVFDCLVHHEDDGAESSHVEIVYQGPR